MSNWTVERIVEFCENECRKLDVNFDIPVKINGRLTSTLGRVCYYPRAIDDVVRPRVLEVSKELLETASEESIKAVIQHECAHFIATVLSGENHRHDAYFKDICRQLGCDNDKTTINVERIVAKNKIFKYAVVCKDCGATSYYRRKTKVVSHYDWYTCGKCGGELFVTAP